jgi:hypothetical protein
MILRLILSPPVRLFFAINIVLTSELTVPVFVPAVPSEPTVVVVAAAAVTGVTDLAGTRAAVMLRMSSDAGC